MNWNLKQAYLQTQIRYVHKSENATYQLLLSKKGNVDLDLCF